MDAEREARKKRIEQTPSEELAYGPSESSLESSEEALGEEPINTKCAKGNHNAFAKQRRA